MPGNDLQPLHQHPVLIIRDSHSLIRCPWPAERTVIQSFIQEKEPVTFPQKRFDPVIPSSTEEEERIFIIWIKRILKADDGCQTIDPTAEIREARCEYYGAAEPPVRCGESHLSGLTEPPHFVY